MGHHDDSGRPGFTMELKWISGRIVVLCAVISSKGIIRAYTASLHIRLDLWRQIIIFRASQPFIRSYFFLPRATVILSAPDVFVSGSLKVGPRAQGASDQRAEAIPTCPGPYPLAHPLAFNSGLDTHAQ
jgi:hypothetical protein